MQNFFLSIRLNSLSVVGFHPGSTCRGRGLCCVSRLWSGEVWKSYGKNKSFISKLPIATEQVLRSASWSAFCFASILQEASEASKQFTFFYTSPRALQLKCFKLINCQSTVSKWTQAKSRAKEAELKKMVLGGGGLRQSSCPQVKYLWTSKFPKMWDQFSSQPLGCLHVCHHLWVLLPDRKNKISESNQVTICRQKTIIYTSSFNLLLSGCSCPSLEWCREGWPRRNVLSFAASGHSVRY